MKTFHGVRTQECCTVQVTEGDKTSVLSPARSLKIRNHSPTGFEWGYGGSGPAQLALALLLEVTGDRDVAEKLYQDFKFEVVAKWSNSGGWMATEDEIIAWIKGTV